HIEFDVPAPNTDPEATTNTLLTVHSVVNSGYVGDVQVEYNRLDLDGFTQYGAAEIIIAEDPTHQDILDAFNQLYDANLQLEDIDQTVDLPVPDFDGEIYTLTAAPGSLAYIGTIDVLLSIASTPLSDVITTTVLSGLEFPEPEGEPEE